MLAIVGGEVLGPVWALETVVSVCRRLSEVAGSLISTQSIQTTKRLTFLFYELKSRMSTEMNLADLADFMFDDLGFKTVDEKSAGLKQMLLPEVLQNRCGFPLIIGMIFRGLAHQMGLSVEFVRFPDLSILKACRDGKVLFMDLRQRGKFLEKGDMLELLQSRPGGGIQEVSFETLDDLTIVTTYLHRLAREFLAYHQDESAIEVYELLFDLQPKNLSILRDRSMAYYRLNRFADALADLKRFLSFSDPAQQSPELLGLLRTLEIKAQDHPH